MSTGNPIEQLRRRMQAHATPAAFAALAEDHRRAGRLAEAIAVCRDGLARYPAYVSARVTLGRALLDSGDASSALAELEQAVAQAPDNLAAARALESAHTALGTAPPPPPLPSPTDLQLHAADEDTASIASSVVAEALTAAADGPQEFGLSQDWSIPDAPGVAAAGAPGPPVPDAESTEDGDPLAFFAQAEAPTNELTPRHSQGDELASIWCVPVPMDEADDSIGGARVCSWALDPSADAGESEAAEHLTSASVDPACDWDAPTVAVAVADLRAEPLPSDPDALESAGEAIGLASDQCQVQELASDARLEAAPESVGADAADSVDPHASPFWSAVFGGEPEPETPPPFAGWDDESPATAPGADRSPWSDEGIVEPTDAWALPDGPSAAWALGEQAESSSADLTPFASTAPDHAESPPPPRTAVVVPAATDHSVSHLDVAWAGSVKSALGEVFARAGRGESQEPPPHASAAVRTAMADAAVEAAIEDDALRDDAPTSALASLQQMLDSVRARRAALFHDVQS